MGKCTGKISIDLIRAGVAAYYSWDREKHDPERLVAEIFFAFREASTHRGSPSQVQKFAEKRSVSKRK